MTKVPAFQFYAADYLADEHVQLMTLEEEGAYIRALAYCWREGSIPADPDALSRLLKGGSTTVVRVVQARFKQHPEFADRLVHPRLEAERQKQEKWRTKSAEGGRSSAEKREQKRKARVVEPNSNSSSSSSFTPSEEKKERRAAKPRDPRLDHPALKAVIEIKGCYPHKDTWDAVIKIVGDHPDLERLRECWVAWRLKNYAPGNLGWLTDWYVNGMPGATNGTNRESSTERSARNLRENAEYIRELDLSGGSRAGHSEDPVGLLPASV